MKNVKAAVFSDVEGTLVDASLPRLSLQVGSKMGVFPRWKVAELAVYGLLAKVLPSKYQRRMRFYIIKRAMVGRTEAEVAQLCEALTPRVVAKLKQANWERVKRQRDEGMPLVLMSAGLHEAIARLGQELGARGEGTHFVVRGGKYLSQFDGPICEGTGKRDRALSIARELGCDPGMCYAYGDTATDIPFLEAFGHPYAVDPDAALEAEAKRRGWEILRSTS
ncbi:MAG: haloacid dehalogenase-like hydrolase [Chloroflexota bacterium]|nr:haloacid dehalogenase-like hydrolase [Chloroflexota bacterium]MDQ5866758.1 haloacid dehalogenase-like hydrolase [Chloroflexota bacterium]